MFFKPNNTFCTVLLIHGAELMPLFQNCVHTLRATGHARDILVFTTLADTEELDKLAVKYQLQIIPMSTMAEVKNFSYANCGSSDFNKISHYKWDCILEAFKRGYGTVVFCDCDIAFSEDHFPYIREARKVYAIGVQSEAIAVFPIKYCTGFMYFARTRWTVRFIHKLRSFSNDTSFEGNDQHAFNQLARGRQKLTKRILALPEALFRTGKQVPANFTPQINVVGVKQRDILFHANWVGGIKNKIVLLKSVGMWKI